MRRLLTAGVFTAALVAASTPVAHAHPMYHYEGDCELVSVYDGSSWHTALVAATVATYSDGVPSPLTNISVACDLYRNDVYGYVGAPLSASGIGSAVGVTTSVTTTPDDAWYVCASVTVGGEEHYDCHRQVHFVDLLTTARGALDLTCGQLPVVTLGGLTVTDDGDVYVNGEPVLDCDGLLG